MLVLHVWLGIQSSIHLLRVQVSIGGLRHVLLRPTQAVLSPPHVIDLILNYLDVEVVGVFIVVEFVFVDAGGDGDGEGDDDELAGNTCKAMT